jgi:DnaK suppressor protein
MVGMDGSLGRESLAAARVETLELVRSMNADFHAMVAASADTNADDEHDPEGSTIAFERSQLAALLAQAQSRLEELAAAEQRLDAGTYGICESCGGPISAARLSARPATRTCITCA